MVLYLILAATQLRHQVDDLVSNPWVRNGVVRQKMLWKRPNKLDTVNSIKVQFIQAILARLFGQAIQKVLKALGSFREAIPWVKARVWEKHVAEGETSTIHYPPNSSPQKIS